MKHKLICCFMLFVGLITNAQNTVNEIEYFFDTDPGVGNAIKINVTDVANLNETVAIPVNSLTAGIHILHIRSKNNLNKWSLYARQTFYITNFSSALNSTITEAEYFFDTDPGVGNAEKLSIASGTTLNSTLAIPVNGLTDGIHILHIRTKNNLNTWSLYARQVFYITNFSSSLNNTITEAEYFFDTDPGVGNAEKLSVANGTALNSTLAIPVSGLTLGIHILHIRTKNSLNKWSLYARQVFYISKFSSTLNNTITNVEFFIDTDPGVGNATALSITPGATINETLQISIPNNLSVGDHIIHIRSKSSNGNWSLYSRQAFTSTSTLSNDDFVLKNLNIYPNPVEDILYFSLQNNTIDNVKLLDVNGKVVIETSGNLNSINVSNLAKGFYLIQIKTPNGSVSKKIIKE